MKLETENNVVVDISLEHVHSLHGAVTVHDGIRRGGHWQGEGI